MAVGAFTFTDPGYLAVRKGTIDLENDTISAVLVDTAHTAALTDDTYSDISTNECASGDYAPVVVTGLTWSQVSSRNFKLDAALVDYGNAVTIAARYIYLVKRADVSLVAGDLIVGYMDLNTGGGNVSSTAGDFDVDWDVTNGLFTETVS